MIDRIAGGELLFLVNQIHILLKGHTAVLFLEITWGSLGFIFYMRNLLARSKLPVFCRAHCWHRAVY
jgi:hypothetical protein